MITGNSEGLMSFCKHQWCFLGPQTKGMVHCGFIAPWIQNCWIQHEKIISDMAKRQDSIGQQYAVCWLLFHKLLVCKVLTWEHKACDELECTVARSRNTLIALLFKSCFSVFFNFFFKWSWWSSILRSPQPSSESSTSEVHQFKILVCSSLKTKCGHCTIDCLTDNKLCKFFCLGSLPWI